MGKFFTAILGLLLFMTAIPGAALAQTVAGRAVDAQSGEPLLFANVVLVKAADTTQVTGTSSDAEGRFVFKKMAPGRYFIQISTLGYHLANSVAFDIHGKADSVSLPPVPLTPTSLQLQEVEVRAKRPMVEMKPGKIVMNVAEHLAATTAENAYEMLKKFPGVTIDNNDNISLNGKAGVLVMVDGRNTYLGGKDLVNYLKALPARSVSSIEAIANPSSKYDAEGVGGIIDIKTDHKRERGFNGSVSAGGGLNLNPVKGGSTDGSVDLNFRTEKVSVYGNLSYWYYNSQNRYYDRTTFADGTSQRYADDEKDYGVLDQLSQGMWARAGVDYYPTKRDILGVAYRGSGYWGHTQTDLPTQWFKASGDIRYSLMQAADSRSANQNHNLTANYEHTFDTVHKRKLYADFTWMRGENGGHGNNALTYYRGDFGQVLGQEAYYLDNPSISDVYALRVDYEHPFSQQGKLEAGVKLSYVDNRYQDIYEVEGLRDTNRSNGYLYNELIGAAYVMYSHNFTSKTSLQVGLRGEITALKGYNPEMDSTHERLYGRPFPNLNLSQQIGQHHRLNLSYRYRLTRPSYYNLNPFMTRTTATDYHGGNPDLDPEYSHNLDLTYSYKYNLFITAGYVHTDGNINSMTYYREVGNSYIAYVIPENMGRADFVTLSVNGNYTFFDRWRLRFFLSGSYGHRTFDYALPEGGYSHEDVRCYDATAWLGTDVDIIKTLTAELSVWARLPSQNMFRYTRPYVNMSLSIKKTFFKEKLSVTLTANDLLGMMWSETTRYPDGTVGDMTFRQGGQQLSLSVSYNFGNNKLMRSRRQGKELEESGRMGGGNGSGGR